MGEFLSCCKAYDIRGKVPGQLNADLAYRVGRSVAAILGCNGLFAIGHDCRLSGPALADAVRRGLNDGGVDTVSLGLCGTEQVYHAAASDGFGGGLMITASHNPADENGMKMVSRDPASGVIVPVTVEAGLAEIEAMAASGRYPAPPRCGRDRRLDLTDAYLARIRSIVAGCAFRPLKVVADCGNGCAGLVLPRLVAMPPALPFELVVLHGEPDGTFPNDVPNPLLPENRARTAAAVKAHGADLGVAWDGDFDRCFLFDETGAFVEGYYIVGLLAASLLAQHPGERVIHDPRLFWNTQREVSAAGAVAIASRTGHARIKEMMARHDALYGGELSAHHYFRDFAYCDTGMVPWLLVAGLVAASGQPLSELVAERRRLFPCSDEINRKVGEVEAVWRKLMEHFASEGPTADFFDGLTLTFGDRWRFNLRQSDTQPDQLRLNVEARGDAGLVAAMTAEILDQIREFEVA